MRFPRAFFQHLTSTDLRLQLQSIRQSVTVEAVQQLNHTEFRRATADVFAHAFMQITPFRTST